MAGKISWFWNERFWLPPNTTWADLRSTDDSRYPALEDLYIVFPYAVLLLFIRLCFERLIGMPFGRLLGIKQNPNRKPEPNTILEKAYNSVTHNPDKARLTGLAKQLDWSERQVERWFRIRRNYGRPSTLTKFSETSWRFLFYVVASVYGMTHVPYEPWFWDTRKCWEGFPYHPIEPFMYNYYFMELVFHWCLILSVLFDVKRKDFLPNIIHHFVTVMLISFSWVCNFVRIGGLVLTCHDMSDVFLESAKMSNYAKRESLTTVLFSLFAITFFLSRIVLLPYRIIYSSIIECREIVGYFPSHIFLNGLMVVLQILHFYWFYLISCMVYSTVIKGKVGKDNRSDDEDTEESDEIPESNGDIKNHVNNGTEINSSL
ncbi:ceramide synthase 6-like [Anneissia japonica]|uniref:ceramide synthase 6-like n=1 Tax=Anneissia japonica TaxID=1529436 RepID=UPI001425A33B|nr:ceramide synthase 6-like [Anneissia japonica]